MDPFCLIARRLIRLPIRSIPRSSTIRTTPDVPSTSRLYVPGLRFHRSLAFGDWNPVFQGERMTALLDRLTHHCHIFELNGESCRFRDSMKAKKERKDAEGRGRTILPPLPRVAII
ncbi:ATP-binding protein [Singulisphaera sp. GP187]|uniref:ATP-binding protein n=1 Tax=Singulisphaera sp. GP187 TaxID=1882752 RepID=UPI00094097B6